VLRAPRRRRPRRTPPARLDVGAALGRTFSIFARHFPVLALLAAVLFAPVTLLTLDAGERAFAEWLPWSDADPYWERRDYWDFLDEETGLGVQALGWVTPWFFQILVTYAVFQALRRKPARYDRSALAGIRRSLPALAAAMLTGVVAILPTVLGRLMGAAMGSMGAALVLVSVGLAFTAVVYCTFFVSVQVAIVEGGNPARAMARSARLTEGVRWKVFAVLLVFAGGSVLRFVLMRATSFDEPVTLAEARRGILVTHGVDVFFTALMAVASAVVYHDLRTSKEGVGVEELVRVFE
jgi:hypothetical protein